MMGENCVGSGFASKGPTFSGISLSESYRHTSDNRYFDERISTEVHIFRSHNIGLFNRCKHERDESPLIH